MKFSGNVIPGEGIGRTLGFPTANLDVVPDLPQGVYATFVTIEEETYEGVMCVGAGAGKCEVYLIGISPMLYGKRLEVEVVGERISGVEELEGEALIRKIERDVAKAKDLLEYVHRDY